MSTTTAPLTAMEFEQLPEKPGFKQELIGGVIVEMGHAGWRHENVKANAIWILNRYRVGNAIGVVFSETMFRLNREEDYIPDVSFMLNHRVHPDAPPTEPHKGAPDLAIEIVSSETFEHMEAKVRGYFGAGAQAVWVALPAWKAIRVFARDGSSRALEAHGYLEDEALLPGFRVLVSEFFEGI